jgi:hypothetical protein
MFHRSKVNQYTCRNYARKGQGRGVKKNGGEGEFKYDIFDIL